MFRSCAAAATRIGYAIDAAEMTADLEEMERMIGGHLAFARGEQAEQAREIDLSNVLEEVAAGARRAGAVVRVEAPAGMLVHLRPDAARRAITNLVDNARRHAARVQLGASQTERAVLVTVDDDGPGIPPDRRESVSGRSRAIVRVGRGWG